MDKNRNQQKKAKRQKKHIKRNRNHQEINLQKIGMKRRKKEVRHMRVMAGLTVFFLAVTLLFQDNMSSYQMEMNYRDYGKWFLRAPIGSAPVENAYLENAGEIWTGSMLYQKKSGDSGKEIEMESYDDRRSTGKIIGCMDQDIIRTGNIRLYEGRFPEKENEIAMDLSALQALNLSYDLGQKISFYLAENEDMVFLTQQNKKMRLKLVTYTLVGTIKSYASMWVEGDALPNAVVSAEAFGHLPVNKKGYRFSSIRQEYVEKDALQAGLFAEELWDSMEKRLGSSSKEVVVNGEEGYIFNSFAYRNPFWGNRVMYRNMTILLVVLGSCVMAYLMSSYLSKRRQFYFRLREIGATVYQIWKMAGYECLFGTVPAAAVSLLLSYLLSLLMVFGIAKGTGIPFFYVFLWKTFFFILAAVCLVLFIAMFAALLIFRSRRITDSGADVPKWRRGRLKRHSQRRKKLLTLKNVWKREQICHPVSVVFLRLVGILACVAVIACMMQIYEQVRVYQLAREEYVDYEVCALGRGRVFSTADVPVKPYLNEETGERVTSEQVSFAEDDTCSMNRFIPDYVIQNIRELSGVKQMDCITKDIFHIFSWKGKEHSSFWKRTVNEHLVGEPDLTTELGRKYVEVNELYQYETRYYADCKEIWQKLKNHLDQKTADYDAFCRGEQGILLESNLVTEWEEDAEDSTEKMIELDSTIKPGDTLTVQTKGKGVSVVVAGVMSADELDFSGSPYILVGSEKLGRRIAKEDSKEYGYNTLRIRLNAMADAEATGKIIARQCERNQLSYDSYLEYIQNAWQQMLRSVLVYGMLAVVIFVLYLFALSNICQEENRKREKKQKALYHMGVSRRRLNKARILDGGRDAAYLLFAVPIVYIIWGYRIWGEWSGNTIGCYSSFFQHMIYDMTEEKYIFYGLLDAVDFRWLAGFMLFACGMVFLFHIYGIKEER